MLHLQVSVFSPKSLQEMRYCVYAVLLLSFEDKNESSQFLTPYSEVKRILVGRSEFSTIRGVGALHMFQLHFSTN